MAQYALVKCNINGKDVEKIVDVRASRICSAMISGSRR